jgi:ADP-heptose:LPS heptosyltransferase
MSGPPLREIAVVEMLGGFGDLLLVLPAIHALARAHPMAAIRVVTLAPGDTLLAADPAVASVTVGSADDPAGTVAAHLDQRPAELAVSTTMHSGIAELLRVRVPRAVTNLWRSPPADELVERRFLRLLAADGFIRSDDQALPLHVVLTADERAAARQVLGALDARPVLLLPGAGMPVKRWPLERWQQLAETLHAAGRPLLTVADGPPLPHARVLPALSLRELAAVAAVLADAGGVAAGGDTGPVRLATAAGLPAVGLYGATLGARYGLSHPAATNLQGLPGCHVRRPTAITEQECWWSARCPLSDDGAPACMADLDVAAVVEAILTTG